MTGYEAALDEGIEVTCVIAADNQMDPADLLTLVEPVARSNHIANRVNWLPEIRSMESNKDLR